MAKSNAEIAVQLQAKFEIYFLGLIFTILGLSIQTARFGSSDLADGFELSGWVFLLISALTGILRGEWTPVMFQIFDKKASTERQIDGFEAQLARGLDVPVTFVNENGQEERVGGAIAVTRLKSRLRSLEEQQRNAEKRLRFLYRLMKWPFFAAVVSLVIARGYASGKPLFLKWALLW